MYENYIGITIKGNTDQLTSSDVIVDNHYCSGLLVHIYVNILP